ncbi:MAG: ATP-dependent helicase [Chitinophagaceae bacterium]
MDYLEGLNEKQREAVLQKDGPLMIVAGAGSGKTKVLTTRIAHLMSLGVDPIQILALTFTNKAAREMRERVENILGTQDARNLYIGTFHSVFARILRMEAERLGFPKSFTIYDTDDSKNIVKRVVRELGMDEKLYKPGIVFNRISAAKNSLIGPEEYQLNSLIQQEDFRSNRPMTGEIYGRYSRICFKNGAMDFDDLLYQMYRLLISHPDIMHKYQHRFRYILIDEYQDTNPAQYQIIKLLGSVHENICVVGDDAQSIYSFRGATIQNILQFEKDYDDVRVVKLEQNYRSSKSILHIANEVIANNKDQIPKALWTDNADGEKIRLVRTGTDTEEGKFVADSIAEYKLRYHFSNSDFAILYRTNAQSRSFEETLRRMNIPYRIYGGISFYQRKEVKDFLAYLRLVVNIQDEESLMRIINVPARGIGKTTLEKMMVLAHEHQITSWQILKKSRSLGFRAGTLEVLENFVTMVESFRTQLQKHNAYEVALAVSKSTGLVTDLFNDKSMEGVARYENIQELLNSIKAFTETPTEDGELTDKDLGSYLQQITLLTDADDEEGATDVVKLMTIHAAKGLEFPCVFVVGLEEGLFPSGMAINTKEGLEEERRLFYVAVTRAKVRLTLSFANLRYRFGQAMQNDSSRFLNEIPKTHVDLSFAGGATRNGWGGNHHEKRSFEPRSREEGNSPNASYSGPVPKNKVVEHIPSPGFTADSPRIMEEGMEVEHQKFGFGKILKLEGAASNRIATIFFKNGTGEKKIMLNYAKLQIQQKD